MTDKYNFKRQLKNNEIKILAEEEVVLNGNPIKVYLVETTRVDHWGNKIIRPRATFNVPKVSYQELKRFWYQEYTKKKLEEYKNKKK